MLRFETNCDKFFAPIDFENGLNIPVTFNPSKGLLKNADGFDSYEILHILKQYTKSNVLLLPKLEIDCFLELGFLINSYKIEKGKWRHDEHEFLMNSDPRHFYKRLFGKDLDKFENNVLGVGMMNYIPVDARVWHEDEEEDGKLLTEEYILKEVSKRNIVGEQLLIKRDKKWLGRVTDFISLKALFGSTIAFNKKKYSLVRDRGHVVVYTLRYEDGKYVFTLYDPNGDELVHNDMFSLRTRLFEKVFNNSNVDFEIELLESINARDSHEISSMLKELHITTSESVNGYCASISYLYFLDILCTQERIYSDDHYDDLLRDIEMRMYGQKRRIVHQLSSVLYFRALMYHILRLVVYFFKTKGAEPDWWREEYEEKLGEWNALALPETVLVTRTVSKKNVRFESIGPDGLVRELFVDLPRQR